MSWNTVWLKWRQVYKDLMYLGAKVLQLYGKDVLTKGFMVRVCCILVRQLLKGKFSVWTHHFSKEKFRGKQASEIQSPSWLMLSLNSLQFQALNLFLPFGLRKTKSWAMSCNNTSRSCRFLIIVLKGRVQESVPRTDGIWILEDSHLLRLELDFFNLLSPILIIKFIP